jgi:predicted transcriptional regulator
LVRTGQDDLDVVFKALGNITRRRILRLLAQKPRYAYELNKLLGLDAQKGPRIVRKHLEVLQGAGMVQRERGESELGPDRVYYKLNVSFGLSTTILPNSFVVRITESREGAPSRPPSGYTVPEGRPDVKMVKQLLRELERANRKLHSIDEERLRFASLRGRIIRRIESIMEECEWDQKSCQKVRSLLNPVRSSEQEDRWLLDSLEEAHQLFEQFFKPHQKKKARVKDEVDAEKSFEVDVA